MAWNGISITDCDGHLVESIPEMVDYLDPLIRPVVTRQSRQRQGLFPSLDGYHYPGNEETSFGESMGRVRASDHRTGSGEDILAFLEKSDIQDTVIFPSEGLAVGNIGLPEYAVRVCRGYNDYVADRFARISPRIHPMALIPMQDVPAAVEELRRAVRELGLVGAMLPSTGMPVHLAHELYWPIYKEAADLGCALGVHGGANVNIGDAEHLPQPPRRPPALAPHAAHGGPGGFHLSRRAGRISRPPRGFHGGRLLLDRSRSSTAWCGTVTSTAGPSGGWRTT